MLLPGFGVFLSLFWTVLSSLCPNNEIFVLMITLQAVERFIVGDTAAKGAPTTLVLGMEIDHAVGRA